MPIKAQHGKRRGIETVAGKESFPVLVVQGYGSALQLFLKIAAASSESPMAFLADRSLIQAVTVEDGSQKVRARYLVRRILADHVDVELLMPVSRFHDRPTFVLGGYVLNASPLDKDEKVMRVKLPAAQSSLARSLGYHLYDTR